MYFFPILFSSILSLLLPLSVIGSRSLSAVLCLPSSVLFPSLCPHFHPRLRLELFFLHSKCFSLRWHIPLIFPPPLPHLPHSPSLPSLCLYLCLSLTLSTPSLCSVFLSLFFLLSGRTFLSSHTQESH